VANEYLIGSGVAHSNLLRSKGCGLANGLPFLVMEYMPSTLETLVARGPLDEGQAVHLLLQAARGVAALHDEGLAHGDLKPSNLLYDAAKEQVKVGDFGTAAVASVGLGTALHAQRSITAAFASPERILTGAPPSQAADVYSLGLILLLLLRGRQPLTGLPLGEIMKAQMRGLQWESSSVTEPAAAVLARCLKRRPEERYRSARELAWALGDVTTRRDRPCIPAGGKSQANAQLPCVARHSAGLGLAGRGN
jgi:serine/threonine-protein kinase